MLLIVVLSFALPWFSYGATPEIPMPKRSADMYNWHDWSSEGIDNASILVQCNDKSYIWKVHLEGESNDYCIQVTFVDDNEDSMNVVEELDQMRSAPNCRCPASSY